MPKLTDKLKREAARIGTQMGDALQKNGEKLSEEGKKTQTDAQQKIDQQKVVEA
ncbi:MAG: hypothetical protein JWM09_1155, partial [Francisellaceae bacterium]|nr:hypothetical protein [Francisellaceae bacterium]